MSDSLNMIINGKKVSAEMNLYKMELCDCCDSWMDEGDEFCFVDGDKWCIDCVESLKD